MADKWKTKKATEDYNPYEPYADNLKRLYDHLQDARIHTLSSSSLFNSIRKSIAEHFRSQRFWGPSETKAQEIQMDKAARKEIREVQKLVDEADAIIVKILNMTWREKTIDR